MSFIFTPSDQDITAWCILCILCNTRNNHDPFEPRRKGGIKY